MLTSQTHRIPLTKRSTMDLAALTQEVPFNERGVGLAEVASLVGINPATLHLRTGSEDYLQKALQNDDGMDRETTYIEVKAEKKSTRECSAMKTGNVIYSETRFILLTFSIVQLENLPNQEADLEGVVKRSGPTTIRVDFLEIARSTFVLTRDLETVWQPSSDYMMPSP